MSDGNLKTKTYVKKLILISKCALFFAYFSYNAFCATKAKTLKMSPAGEAIYEKSLSDYPPFDEEKAKKEAAEIYKRIEKGEEVEIKHTRFVTKGKFMGISGRYAIIGGKNILLDDLDPATINKLNHEKNEELRQKYVRDAKNEYNAKKLNYMQELRDELYQKYPIINENELEKIFSKMEDEELKKRLMDEFRKAYDKNLPVESSPAETIQKTAQQLAMAYPDLIFANGFILSKKEHEAEQKRLEELEQRRKERFARLINHPTCSAPVFEPDGGTFNPEIPITISCATPDAEIRYTTNGKEPNEDSPLYSNPIKLKSAVIVKAKAFHPLFNDSETASIAPWAGGLYASYFSTMTFKGETVTRIDPVLNFNWSTNAPCENIPQDLFSAIWTGVIVPQKTDTYTFYLTGDDGIMMWLNNNVIIDGWKEQPPTEYESKPIKLDAGEKYDIRIAFAEVQVFASVKLEWSASGLSRQIIPQECLFPEGPSTQIMKKWNEKITDASGKSSYPNRSKMMNPAGLNYKLKLKGDSAARWKKLNIGD